ncbi:MAG TPA: multiubiquitin domain-containing protein [Gemmataceae bacterium]|nr:multiubiquitin domain-containing protein [Gemmataceae bacterium]
MREKKMARATLAPQTDDPIEIIDVEAFAKNGQTPPPGKKYRIRIDRQTYDVSHQTMTGRQLLRLAGKQAAERYMISQKSRGGQVRKLELDEVADFTDPGVERFMTLAKDQTEG